MNHFSRVSTPRSRSPLRFLQTRDSSKEKSAQGYEGGTLTRLSSWLRQRRDQLWSLLSPFLRGSWVPTPANGRRRRLWRVCQQSLVLGTIAYGLSNHRHIALEDDWTGRREKDSSPVLTRIPHLVVPNSLITISESTNLVPQPRLPRHVILWQHSLRATTRPSPASSVCRLPSH
ncbi:hypothetical protein BKA70DRAFT_344645 [Coprinopsis sp. MPI-PUGE-AT-0042]|nr:hypothetical protein BKA70DRAFT_344645 [Coprinopsis sp. MPI-PUGE-AT-0042]